MDLPPPLAAILCTLAACRPPAPTPIPASDSPSLTVVDATEAYLAFLRRGGEAPYDDEAERFIEEVVVPHPQLFRADVLGLPESVATTEGLREVLPLYLPHAYEAADQIEAAARTFREDLDTHRSTFMAAFPEFSATTTIYLTVSLGSFDGGTRVIDDEEALLFGIDGIAFVHPPEADLAPFFHHELFHVHHSATLGRGVAQDSEYTLGRALWNEGLATHVSHALNPEASDGELLLSRSMIEQADARLDELAAEIADNLESTDESLVADYFYGGAGDRVPERCGYYIGMRVAETLGRTRSLQELSALHGEELDREVEAALRAMGG